MYLPNGEIDNTKNGVKVSSTKKLNDLLEKSKLSTLWLPCLAAF